MVVSETLNRIKTHMLQACVLLCTMAMLPSGMTQAQDFEAVGKRLRAAVESGELTGEQARTMLGALRKVAEHEGEDEDGIEPVPAEVARSIGKALLKAAPVDFAFDPSQAVGVFADDDGKIMGMLLVPTAGLDENDAEMEIGDSAPLALLFSSAPILPVADGRLIDRDRLHDVTLTDDEGEKHDVNCMVLIVKRIADEDYRIYGIGKKLNEPLIEARFDDGEGPGQTPLAIEVKDIDEESETAAVVITVFNKYQAAFRAGVAE